MSVPVPIEPVSLESQIKAVERELTFRYRVYAGLVAKGRMTLADAGMEIAAMQAVLANLKAQLPPPSQSSLKLD